MKTLDRKRRQRTDLVLMSPNKCREVTAFMRRGCVSANCAEAPHFTEQQRSSPFPRSGELNVKEPTSIMANGYRPDISRSLDSPDYVNAKAQLTDRDRTWRSNRCGLGRFC